MKYTASALLLLAPLIAAQTIADLPSCSLQCVIAGLGEVNCGLSDFECSCQKAGELTPAITPCVQESCDDPADQAKVITVLEGICAAAGFPIAIPTPEMPSVTPEPTPEPTPEETPAPEESSSVAPTIQTSVPTPSATDIVISETSSDMHPAPTSYPVGEETCTIVTYTETVTAAPYPTGPVGTGSPIPVPSASKSYGATPPEFTGAASSVKLPAGIAGVVGLAALFL